jgi:hypothetical protein
MAQAASLHLPSLFPNFNWRDDIKHQQAGADYLFSPWKSLPWPPGARRLGVNHERLRAGFQARFSD